ncbi:MAG: T9SS type A sorting domain-containing protein, partial [Bacteroidota bacterium]
HVLGLQTLDSPYKVIAADINSDEQISAIDLLELRKLILGIYTDLPNNDSWRFVDADQSFDDETSPFPFAEQLSVQLGNENAPGQNFVATKIGDVSGNAIANSLIGSKGRSAGKLALQVTDAAFSAGDVVTVEVAADQFVDIAAYQFTLNTDGLEFVSVTSGAVDMTDESVAVLDANTMTAAWFAPQGVTTDEALFTLTFTATKDIVLSEAMAINSSVTTAEAYTAAADKLDLALAFDTQIASSFTLLQNEPNPFSEITRIGYELPEAATATLTVFDVTGKTVTSVTQDANAGVNFINIRKADLNASGLMYYQLEAGEFTATKKMIVIE